jgi:hypothetical protein
MKKFILKNYYTARIVLLNVRVYFLTNDYNFIDDTWNKEILREKIERLNGKIFVYFLKIQML